MNFLITGANLINKGAQSMLFETVNQLKRRFQSCGVYYGTYRNDDISAFTFDKLYYDPYIKYAVINEKYFGTKRIKQEIKNTAKNILNKGRSYNSINKSLSMIRHIDYIIDISGFALSDRFDFNYNESYLDNIRIAQKLNIPIFLMPQSFGPFNYENKVSKEKAIWIRNEIEILLQYPRAIFVREKACKRFLEEIGIKNSILSNDIVIQSKNIDYRNIYMEAPKFRHLSFEDDRKKVAIIPNMQITTRGFRDRLFEQYSKAIKCLSENNYLICFMQHSGEDKHLCGELGRIYADNPAVMFINQDLNCFEYSEMIRQFDFVISSRFHATVHALKENVPTITVGWAVKYNELLENVGQERYALDITNDMPDNALEELIVDMSSFICENKKIICEKLNEIQSNSCFDIVERFL